MYIVSQLTAGHVCGPGATTAGGAGQGDLRLAAVMTEPARPPASIRTPCVQVCIVDGESGLCLGCYRTLAEVAGWARFTDDERARLMAELPQRRDRIRQEKLGMVR
jgi:predicted Fe-S protein YdhL (DUF1289 family)